MRVLTSTLGLLSGAPKVSLGSRIYSNAHTFLAFLANHRQEIVGDVQSDEHQGTNKADNDEDIECLRTTIVQQKYSNSNINHFRLLEKRVEYNI